MVFHAGSAKAGAYRKHAIYGKDGAQAAGREGHKKLRERLAHDLVKRGNLVPTERDIDLALRAHMCMIRQKGIKKSA